MGKAVRRGLNVPGDAVLPFPLKRALSRVDAQLDALIYEAFPLPKAG